MTKKITEELPEELQERLKIILDKIIERDNEHFYKCLVTIYKRLMSVDVTKKYNYDLEFDIRDSNRFIPDDPALKVIVLTANAENKRARTIMHVRYFCFNDDKFISLQNSIKDGGLDANFFFEHMRSRKKWKDLDYKIPVVYNKQQLKV
jgi:hypothetical protein